MNLILKLLGGSAGTYVLIAVGALILGLAYTSKWLWEERTYLLQKNGALSAQVETAVGANQSQSKTITKLEAAVKSWKDLVGDAAAKQAELTTKADDYRSAIKTLNQKLSTTERIDHANPDCEKIININLATACPNIVSGLYNKAAINR